MKKEKRIFIAATRQNDGKTVVSLGLVMALKKRFKNVGFIKPVGQKYIVVDGEKIDKDAVLIKRVCGLENKLKDINPIAVGEGFTSRYLESPNREELCKRIEKSYNAVAEGMDFVVIEGTGHAGVGSVFDLSNASVASLLKSKVILISIGGIGKPIDEIALNKVFFEKSKVPIKGIIINKVLKEKIQTSEKYLGKGLKRMNLKLVGLIPYVPKLSHPTILQICEILNGKVLAGENKLSREFDNIIVGAMTPRHAIDYFKPNSLLITPGDREDLILAAITYCTTQELQCNIIPGIILTGGLYPHKAILTLIKKSDIPTILCSNGTYDVATKINELVVKIREQDTDKIKVVQNLIEENIDIEGIIS
ncbi:MAG: AAA family ATPase [Candidatus Omnitrophica bacterium]|nr:AAA family ATPase [Candidatus Omnitrophota bacterium]